VRLAYKGPGMGAALVAVPTATGLLLGFDCFRLLAPALIA